MKYITIFCLLLLITSKRELKPKFSLSTGLIRNIYESNIKESGCEPETKDKCKNLPSSKENEVCCYTITKKNDTIISEGCTSYPESSVKLAPLYKMKAFKAKTREQVGYLEYVENIEFPSGKSETKMTCKNGEFSSVIENNFTDEEKNILKNNNHCLNINNKKNRHTDFDVGECKDYLLLDSSKSDGIDCGSYVYNINLQSKNNVYYKTCNLFNLKLISKISNIQQLFDENSAEEIIHKMGIYGDKIESFTAEAYNSNGQKIKYDSRTNKIIIEGSGFKITASKYLFLIILILF